MMWAPQLEDEDDVGPLVAAGGPTVSILNHGRE